MVRAVRMLGQAEHSVYALVDSMNEVRYIGRTGRSTGLRLLEHLRDLRKPKFAELNLRIGREWTALTRAQARGLEEMLYMEYVDTGNLLNKIRPVSILNPRRAYYLEEASEIL